VLPTGTALLAARPGALLGVADAPNFSTCALFAFREMEVRTKNDIDNERTLGRVVEILDCQLTAPSSGFLFSACIS
jgi:hypothetical protein